MVFTAREMALRLHSHSVCAADGAFEIQQQKRFNAQQYYCFVDQILTVSNGLYFIFRYSIPPEEPTKAKQAVVVFTFYSDFI